MAIRYGALYKSGDWVANEGGLVAAVMSGWHTLAPDTSNAITRKHLLGSSYQQAQPATFSRPGNLGTAYNGVWRGW